MNDKKTLNTSIAEIVYLIAILFFILHLYPVKFFFKSFNSADLISVYLIRNNPIALFSVFIVLFLSQLFPIYGRFKDALLILIPILLFMGISLIHLYPKYGQDYIGYVKAISNDKINGNIISFITCCYFVLLLEKLKLIKKVSNSLIKIILFFALLQLFFFSLTYSGPFEFNIDDISENNYISYELSYVLVSILIFRTINSKSTKFIILLCLVSIVLNQTRAVWLYLILSTLYFFTVNKINAKSKTLKLKIISVLVIITACVLSWALYTVHEIAPYFANSVLSKVDREWLASHDYFSYYHRLKLIYLSAANFLTSPIIGLGSDVAYNIRSEGVGQHSFFFLLLNTYGLIGILLMFSIFYNVIKDKASNCNRYYFFWMVASIGFFIIVENQLKWWYPFFLILGSDIENKAKNIFHL